MCEFLRKRELNASKTCIDSNYKHEFFVLLLPAHPTFHGHVMDLIAHHTTHVNEIDDLLLCFANKVSIIHSFSE